MDIRLSTTLKQLVRLDHRLDIRKEAIRIVYEQALSILCEKHSDDFGRDLLANVTQMLFNYDGGVVYHLLDPAETLASLAVMVARTVKVRRKMLVKWRNDHAHLFCPTGSSRDNLNLGSYKNAGFDPLCNLGPLRFQRPKGKQMSFDDNIDSNSTMADTWDPCDLDPVLSVDQVYEMITEQVNLTPLESFIVRENILEDRSLTSLATERGCSVANLSRARKEALIKLKNCPHLSI